MVAEPSSRPGPDIAWCRNRLDEIAALEDDWDTYGAPAPSPTAIANARKFLETHLRGLPLPAIGPGYEGTVEFEWDLPGELALGMSFLPDGTANFAAFTREEVLGEGESTDVADAAAFVTRFLSGSARRGR